MADALSKDLSPTRALTPSVGRQLLEIVTAGMYNDPRMVYREFVQNAADSIDAAIDAGRLGPDDSRIGFTIDGATRSVIVEDNGLGVPVSEVDLRLGSLGRSTKEGRSQRGFRGIGRLGGLAYCDSLVFETRAPKESLVSIVEWDGKALRAGAAKGSRSESLEDAVRRIATLQTRRALPGEPPHFFRAHMRGIRFFHSDELMNINSIRGYLSTEAPVAFEHGKFHFASKIEAFLAAGPGYRTYNILLNEKPVLRPHEARISFHDRLSDEISDIETFEVKMPDGSEAARGWFAKTSLLAALPRANLMRGIRLYQGNIAVGDEYLLADLFTERRFSAWHIGAIHVSRTVRPNARRDGFESSSEFERILEHSRLLARHLSKLCRTLSKSRATRLSAARHMAAAERHLASPIFIDDSHRQRVIKYALKRIQHVESSGILETADPTIKNRHKRLTALLQSVEDQPSGLSDVVDGRRFNNIDPKEVLHRACRAVVESDLDDDSVREVLGRLLDPYRKN